MTVVGWDAEALLRRPLCLFNWAPPEGAVRKGPQLFWQATGGLVVDDTYVRSRGTGVEDKPNGKRGVWLR